LILFSTGRSGLDATLSQIDNLGGQVLSRTGH
jgi:hypothetical protein